MKNLGIIGGLGAGTTAEFYLKIIFDCQKLNKVHRPLIVISSVPCPYKTESDFVLENKNKEKYIPLLVGEAKRLEKAKMDFLVMPCNSLHCHIDEIRSAVKIPVVSIVEETIKHIQKNCYKKIGLISTLATVQNQVYEKEFVKNKIDFLTAEGLEQAQINKVIKNLITGIYLNSDREILLAVIENMKERGAEAIALACTDLQLLLPQNDNIPIFDTMSILANVSVDKILGKDNNKRV